MASTGEAYGVAAQRQRSDLCSHATRQSVQNGFDPEDFWFGDVTDLAEHIACDLWG